MHTAKTMIEDAQSRIKALFQSYRESLPPLLAELASEWDELQKQWDADVAAEFERKVHGLAGSAATFDHEELGQVARELEHTFRPLRETDYDPTDKRWAESNRLFKQLKEMIESVPLG